MASPALSSGQTDPAATWFSLGSVAMRLVQASWLLLQVAALALAAAATPALHLRYQTTCADQLCEILPQPNAQSVQLLNRLGIPLQDYAIVMVGAEWVAMLIWALLGALIVWKRPRDLVALLLAYGGVIGASKAFIDALSTARPELILPAQVGLLVSAVVLPLIFALFPDGRWAPRWTRWVALAAIGYGVAATVAGSPPPALLATLELPLGVAPFVLLLGAQVYRYRRVSNATQRLQTKWVILGISLYVLNFVLIFAASTIGLVARYQFFFLALCYGAFVVLGVATTFAILRYRLFAIDLILNRALVYGGLTAAVIAIYALIVGGLGAALQAREEPAVALLATGVVAVAFQPLRERLQRGANRLLYGDRDDPYAVLSRLGQRLESTLATEEILPAIVRTLTEALRLPYAAIVLPGEAGAPAAVAGVIRMPLTYQAEPVGELVLAPRGPGEAFGPADQRLLADLARQIGVATHAVRLTADLQRSRERIISAREEERRRLRRDLHDGLGAQLAALAIQAGALRGSIARDPGVAVAQAVELRAELKAAVADIRRLVHGLRPPALDELGLLGALRQRAASHGTVAHGRSREDGSAVEAALVVSVIAPDLLPPLPAAVEVAIYRIVDEALANVTRHAVAERCVIRLEVDDRLRLIVEDDGVGIAADRVTGVGMVSMRERAEELGGHFTIDRRSDGPGTRLRVELPLHRLVVGGTG
jgi:signal transduction histidine kinase